MTAYLSGSVICIFDCKVYTTYATLSALKISLSRHVPCMRAI